MCEAVPVCSGPGGREFPVFHRRVVREAPRLHCAFPVGRSFEAHGGSANM